MMSSGQQAQLILLQELWKRLAGMQGVNMSRAPAASLRTRSRTSCKRYNSSQRTQRHDEQQYKECCSMCWWQHATGYCATAGVGSEHLQACGVSLSHAPAVGFLTQQRYLLQPTRHSQCTRADVRAVETQVKPRGFTCVSTAHTSAVC
jgi:hypothetical protein